MHNIFSISKSGQYNSKQLKRWRPAPIVIPNAGMPGEMGKPVHIPPERESEMKEKFKLNQFNLMASDMISLNRSLADVRLDGYVHTEIIYTSFKRIHSCLALQIIL